MTSGIYQLNFNDQAYYIGQSQDLEARWKQHAEKFKAGKAAKKMQDAYDELGMPTVNVLIECHKDYLDIMESYHIAEQRKLPNCLNTTAPALDPKIDYDWLLQNTHMLKISSIDIISNLLTAVKEKDELQVEHDTIKKQLNNKFLITRAPLSPEDLNSVLVQYTQDKIAHIQSELARIKSGPRAYPPIV